MKINKNYLFAFFVLLFVEIMIALFVHDAIIRPFIGDVLVVILMYTLIRGVVKKQINRLPIYLFLFALTIEVTQYFHLVDHLNLQNNRFLSTIMGNSFDLKDILCYLIAAILLILWEKKESKVTKEKIG